MLGRTVLREKIDLDLVCLGFLAIIIRSVDMYFTYRSIRIYGHEEVTPGLRMIFEVMGLEKGILFSQIISAMIIFVIVYFSNLARRKHMKISYTPHILLINYIIGLVLTVHGLMNPLIYTYITVLTLIIVFIVIGLDLKMPV
ncbi:MAG: hypothetical protein DRN04_15765 [Thermoprotei archaeon]|nr:MAG: hypothetical protein DRN04_15765 [Thermoprotei archaeon]